MVFPEEQTGAEQHCAESLMSTLLFVLIKSFDTILNPMKLASRSPRQLKVFRKAGFMFVFLTRPLLRSIKVLGELSEPHGIYRKF